MQIKASWWWGLGQKRRRRAWKGGISKGNCGIGDRLDGKADSRTEQVQTDKVQWEIASLVLIDGQDESAIDCIIVKKTDTIAKESQRMPSFFGHLSNANPEVAAMLKEVCSLLLHKITRFPFKNKTTKQIVAQ